MLNHFSAGRILPYPEQKEGYVVPARYLDLSAIGEAKRRSGDVTPSFGVTPTDTLASSDDQVVRDIELDQSGRPREEDVQVPKDVILVTWEGDDDPENPLNWLVISFNIWSIVLY